MVYRLRIKHNNRLRNLQEEGDESVKTECTISDRDKNMIGKNIVILKNKQSINNIKNN